MDGAVEPPLRAYSPDLKERLVRAMAAGQPMRAAARRFGVAVTTVKRAVVQERRPARWNASPFRGIHAPSGASRKRCCAPGAGSSAGCHRLRTLRLVG